MPGPARPELVFGALARRLEARVHRAGAILRPGGGDEAPSFWLVPGALPPEERALLRGLTGPAGIDLDRVPAGEGCRVTLPAETLRAAAEGRPGLSALLAVHENALAGRRPARLMGIVNVTPDSFSDGGRFLDPRRAVEHGLKLAAEGAEILDVGGESTRPGAASVPVIEELDRVLPVVEQLARSTSASISVDTTRSEVARAALDAGATMVNDVSAGRFDPDMLALVADRGADVILMHMQGSPRDMQDAPSYADVVREVTAHLRERVAACLKAGIGIPRIAVDPGIGFGKRVKDNLDLVRGLPELRSLGLPIVLGVSRKSFLGRLSGEAVPARRLPESLAAIAIGHLYGADVHRVHEVGPAAAALKIAEALLPGSAPDPRNA